LIVTVGGTCDALIVSLFDPKVVANGWPALVPTTVRSVRFGSAKFVTPLPP
jgi:hypothetical protein